MDGKTAIELAEDAKRRWQREVEAQNAVDHPEHYGGADNQCEASARMRGQRGALQIEAAFKEAQKAATRNAHKRNPRQETLNFWLRKTEEERDELEQAILCANPADPKSIERVLEELGDYLWSGICAVDHGVMFELENGGLKVLEAALEKRRM